MDSTGPADLLAAGGGSAGLSATLGVGIKEYMNVPWMPVVDIEAESAGNSLDPSSDRREQSGRGFTNSISRSGTNNRTSAGSARPATDSASSSSEDDQFPYDDVTVATGKGANNGTGAAGEIREPVLRPKSRFRMYRMPDGSAATGNGSSSWSPQVAAANINNNNASTSTYERSFIVHLLPQRLMNMIEQAEKYARMAFSPFVWPSKERAQRALKYFPRLVYERTSSRLSQVRFE